MTGALGFGASSGVGFGVPATPPKPATGFESQPVDAALPSPFYGFWGVGSSRSSVEVPSPYLLTA